MQTVWVVVERFSKAENQGSRDARPSEIDQRTARRIIDGQAVLTPIVRAVLIGHFSIANGERNLFAPGGLSDAVANFLHARRMGRTETATHGGPTDFGSSRGFTPALAFGAVTARLSFIASRQDTDELP